MCMLIVVDMVCLQIQANNSIIMIVNSSNNCYEKRQDSDITVHIALYQEHECTLQTHKKPEPKF